MNIINEVLQELKYVAKESISFKANDVEYNVIPFISEEFPSQVFLVAELNYRDLPLVLKGDYLFNLAKAFCNSSFHKGEMDKNTSLLIKALCDVRELKNNIEKIKIEDDPYYFKKYVFSYNKIEEEKAINYFKDRKEKKGFSYVKQIQNYLLNSDLFEKYKYNPENDWVYSYFIELTAKIPIMPLKILCSNELNTVEYFILQYLNGTDKIIHRGALDRLLAGDTNFKEDDTDTILNKWKKCLEEGE